MCPLNNGNVKMNRNFPFTLQGNNSPKDDTTAGIPVSHTEPQGTDRGNGEGPLYSSVQPANTRTQQDLLHSTVQKPLLECEDDVQYASVQFLPSRAAPRSPAVKEDCVLYATVREHQTRK
ncbi:hypothetical protein COCON_G00151250 [Conger conger]|uniref:Uncharacterized protein n=1 Tax=Conger conger TaxID=82655 RepID=A0A9Q1D8B2_CONCO|nr:hypothetical protein COCON_G00151250 [Conger conger]